MNTPTSTHIDMSCSVDNRSTSFNSTSFFFLLSYGDVKIVLFWSCPRSTVSIIKQFLALIHDVEHSHTSDKSSIVGFTVFSHTNQEDIQKTNHKKMLYLVCRSKHIKYNPSTTSWETCVRVGSPQNVREPCLRTPTEDRQQEHTPWFVWLIITGEHQMGMWSYVWQTWSCQSKKSYKLHEFNLHFRINLNSLMSNDNPNM